MKLEKMVRTQVEATAIQCILPVRHGAEDIPYDFPFRTGEFLDITIDIATGAIRDWPQGRSESCYLKVVDGGIYHLAQADGTIVATLEDYVPECVPGEWGDYVDFDIDESGIIANWKQYCTELNVEKGFNLVRDRD